MATVFTLEKRQFRDLDLNFNVHPVRKDVTKHTGEMAVINSMKNLVLTNFYERPFQPEVGSNLRKLLFENLDTVTAMAINREINQTIKNYEPRVRVQATTVKPDYDNNAYSVTIEFTIVNVDRPLSITFLLERTR
jgi:phage baseplate assembly protein W